MRIQATGKKSQLSPLYPCSVRQSREMYTPLLNSILYKRISSNSSNANGLSVMEGGGIKEVKR